MAIPKKTVAKKTVGGKAARGRPSLYNEKIAEEICDLLASQQSMRQICAKPGMPDRKTVTNWARDLPDFAKKLAQARQAQADSIFDDMAAIEAQTLAKKIDARAARAVLSSMQWRASKLAPKRYGDKLVVHGDADEPPIRHDARVTLTPSEAYRQMLGAK